MDLFKVFDCVPHDFMVAKIHASPKNTNTIFYLFEKPKTGCQSEWMNYLTIFSAAPQGTVLGPILWQKKQKKY